MNAESELAPGRSERWRHPEPRQPAWAAGSRQPAAAGASRLKNIPGTVAFRDTAKVRLHSSQHLISACIDPYFSYQCRTKPLPEPTVL